MVWCMPGSRGAAADLAAKLRIVRPLRAQADLMRKGAFADSAWLQRAAAEFNAARCCECWSSIGHRETLQTKASHTAQLADWAMRRGLLVADGAGHIGRRVAREAAGVGEAGGEGGGAFAHFAGDLHREGAAPAYSRRA